MSGSTLEVRELRRHERFVATPPLEGRFGATVIQVCDIGEGGLQAEHPDPLRVGSSGVVGIRPPLGAEITMIRGRVVWSRLSQTPNHEGKLLYRSGICLEGENRPVRTLLQTLVGQYLRPDIESLARKKNAIMRKARAMSQRPVIMQLTRSITDDQLLLVQQARSRLRANPSELEYYYDQARSEIGTGPSREADSLDTSRMEILAVWQYLQRMLDLEVVARAFEMLR